MDNIFEGFEDFRDPEKEARFSKDDLWRYTEKGRAYLKHLMEMGEGYPRGTFGDAILQQKLILAQRVASLGDMLIEGGEDPILEGRINRSHWTSTALHEFLFEWMSEEKRLKKCGKFSNALEDVVDILKYSDHLKSEIDVRNEIHNFFLRYFQLSKD
ncbi:MAG TPA: hypothetical protein VJB60_03560 [Candidatus Peribacterales bacterium]|nr:hypothetical protein [Candidatus Peribacterales bacterium]